MTAIWQTVPAPRAINNKTTITNRNFRRLWPLASLFIDAGPYNTALLKSIIGSYDDFFSISYAFGWLGGVTVRASDLRSSGRGCDSRPGRIQATRSTQPSILPG